MRKLKIAVIGLSESGKTVFLHSLINNLLQENLNNLIPGLEISFSLQSMQTETFSNPFLNKVFTENTVKVNDFPFRELNRQLRKQTNEDESLKSNFSWPTRTNDVSGCNLKIIYRRPSFRTRKVLDLQLFDYPGEKIADFSMLSQDFTQWSRKVINYLDEKLQISWESIFKESFQAGHSLEKLGCRFFNLILQLKNLGFNHISPSHLYTVGKDGDYCNQPDYHKFFPAPENFSTSDPTTFNLLQKRYEEYRNCFVKPTFDLLKSCSHQVVLVDVLRILTQGLDHKDDFRQVIEGVFDQFNYRSSYIYERLLTRLPKDFELTHKPVKKVLFLATKADKVHSESRENLKKLVLELIGQIKNRVEIIAKDSPDDPVTECGFISSMKCTETLGNDLVILKTGDRIQSPPQIPDSWPVKQADYDKFKNLHFKVEPPDEFGDIIPTINLEDSFLRLIQEELK